MANIVEQCQNLDVFFNGIGWAGLVDGFVPPNLASNVEEYRAAGMDVPVPLRMGQEAMETEIVFNGFHEDVIASWGLADGTALTTTVRGALQAYTGGVKPIRFDFSGPITSFEWERVQGQGEVPKVTLMQGLHYVKIALSGNDLIEIDALNFTRIIKGVDQLEEIRGALGL